MRATDIQLEHSCRDCRHAADHECVCGEPIIIHRCAWRCPTCRERHFARVCYNCSRILDYGTDHGEQHQVALVAAADRLFDTWGAEVSGRPLAEVMANSCAVNGPARHLS